MSCRLFTIRFSLFVTPDIDFHSHSKFRPQRDLRLEADSLIGDEAEFPFAGDGGDQQNAFGPGKTFADTAADAAAEREVDVSLAGLFDALFLPPFGNEIVGRFPKPGVAVDDERAC